MKGQTAGLDANTSSTKSSPDPENNSSNIIQSIIHSLQPANDPESATNFLQYLLVNTHSFDPASTTTLSFNNTNRYPTTQTSKWFASSASQQFLLVSPPHPPAIPYERPFPQSQ
jgi:hypothetical protein